MTLAGKLNFLSEKLAALLEDLRPTAVSVETVFTARNVSSAVKLAHARGVLLAAAAHFDVPVFEYEPRLVKKALVGYGQAEKPQVRAMVLTLLARERERVPLDAADALAVAICHVHASPAGSVGRR
jgi:crossover junction endodeoxyribonuclease RuvC